LPAGARGVSGVCALGAGQRGPADFCELVAGQRGPAGFCELSFDRCCSSGGPALVVGQRAVESFTGQRAWELSAGLRDAALLSDDGGITPSLPRSTSTIPPTSALGFGRNGLGARSGARARPSFAAALSGSNRGGSVCFLT